MSTSGRLRKTVEQMGSAKRGFAIKADMSSSAEVKAMFAEIEGRYGALDILVNNASRKRRVTRLWTSPGAARRASRK